MDKGEEGDKGCPKWQDNEGGGEEGEEGAKGPRRCMRGKGGLQVGSEGLRWRTQGRGGRGGRSEAARQQGRGRGWSEQGVRGQDSTHEGEDASKGGPRG